MFQRITGGKCNLSLGKTCFSTSESKGCDWSPPLRCLGIGVLRKEKLGATPNEIMWSSSIKQCLWYQVKNNTAKLSFFLPSHSNSGDLVSPKPLLYKILNDWNFKQVVICDFMLFIFNQTLKHKDSSSKTSKDSPPNFLNHTLRWERDAMSEPFLWSVWVLRKDMAQTCHLFISKTMDMILLIHKIKSNFTQVMFWAMPKCVVWIPQP